MDISNPYYFKSIFVWLGCFVIAIYYIATKCETMYKLDLNWTNDYTDQSNEIDHSSWSVLGYANLGKWKA